MHAHTYKNRVLSYMCNQLVNTKQYSTIPLPLHEVFKLFIVLSLSSGLLGASQVTTFLISQPLNQTSILPTSNLIVSTSMQQSSVSNTFSSLPAIKLLPHHSSRLQHQMSPLPPLHNCRLLLPSLPPQHSY